MLMRAPGNPVRSGRNDIHPTKLVGMLAKRDVHEEGKVPRQRTASPATAALKCAGVRE